MRASSLLSPPRPVRRKLWSLFTVAITTVSALNTPQPVTQPSLDLSKLGRVGLVGDFSSISLLQYTAQAESSPFSNSSQSLLSQLPNGLFTSLELADSSINTMCVYELQDGTQKGIVVGGNFTSLGNVEANGIALYNPDDNSISALGSGNFEGKVNAVLCDKNSSSVYVGGMFNVNNSSNAIVWQDGNWVGLPFQGFNSQVETIAMSNNNSIIFGGLFDSLNNFTAVSPTVKNAQTVNIGAANITAIDTKQLAGFDDPAAITCSNTTNGQQWLVEDNSLSGSWKASFQSHFTPTKLRLTNANFQGRGTRVFRFTASDLGAIMNLTWTDPTNHTQMFCDAWCPLAQSDEPQDFTFVNEISMQDITINIFGIYGDGGGLAGVELFQDDIFTFADPSLNEPTCAAEVTRANSSTTGDWTAVTGIADSTYLSANVPTGESSDFQVVFEPHIQQAGDYDVLLFTPGCTKDNTCSTRGEVNVTVTFEKGKAPQSTTLFQTNDYDKYDKVYSGPVGAASDSFRPQVTLSPTSSQTNSDATIVAQKVQFRLTGNITSSDSDNSTSSNSTTSSGQVNGIYEYFPATNKTTDPTKSVISSAGLQLNDQAAINSIVVSGDVTFVGGNFSTNESSFQNFFSIDSKGPVLPVAENGLIGGIVKTMLLVNDLIYVGGSFTSTGTKATTGLASVGTYDTGANKWKAMGAGLNGNVNDIVLIKGLNLTTGAEDCIGVSGDFTQIKGGANNQAAVSVEGFAIWVPSKSQWLAQMSGETLSITGALSAGVEVNNTSIYAGSVSSNSLSSDGVVYLTSSDDEPTLAPSSLQVTSTSGNSGSSKRDLTAQNSTLSGGIVGAFYTEDSNNLTIIGGRFAAQGSSGTVNNLAFIDGSSSNITGITNELDTDSIVYALDILDTSLFVGGALQGGSANNDIAGLLIWDLSANKLASTQPPALQGNSISVNAISTRPQTSQVYVGGAFNQAGGLPCPSLCIFDNDAKQWNQLGPDVSGTVNTMYWVDKNTLLVGGNMTINNTATYIVTFDAKNAIWAPIDDVAKIPGPVTSLSTDTGTSDSLFVSGTAIDKTPFLMKLQNQQFTSLLNGLGSSTQIRDIQVLQLNENAKHASSQLMQDDHTLLVTGSLDVTGFGNASAATYNGTTWTAFLLSSQADGSQGSIATFMSENAPVFSNEGKSLAKGFVILISLAIALALVFLIVVAGVLASYIRRRREGYVPAPTMAGAEKTGAMQDRVPPENLFSSVGPNAGRQGGATGAPMI